MSKKKTYAVIGAGSAGLVIAIGLARTGKKVYLIDKGSWGGDCTNFGCVPSKALIALSKEGVAKGALEKVRQIRSEIRSHEDPEALKKMGVIPVEGIASFTDPHTIVVGDETINANYIIIATGSSPRIPEIEGLDPSKVVTNETIFELKKIPKSLLVLGGGPIGVELAQAFAKLGTKVTLLHKNPTLFDRETPAVAPVMDRVFQEEGIEIFYEAQVEKLEHKRSKTEVYFTHHQDKKNRSAEYVLVATGRVPNVGSLQLDAAGVAYAEEGIQVDRYGRTNRKHIYAVGDVTGPPFFTHLAENRARSILVSLLLPFGLRRKRDVKQPIPHCTFTTPEVASFGLSPKQAEKKYGKKSIYTYKVDLSEVDRAICERKTQGFIEVVTKKWSSKILGATVVGPRAGEMLMELSTAAFAKIPLRKLAGLIHPYPIYNLGIRKAADLWFKEVLMQRKKQ